MSDKAAQWFVYMLRCADNSLYTGITTDPQRREQEHNSSKGSAAKYTRARQPVVMVYQEAVSDRSFALRREIELKKLPKKQKEALVKQSAQC